jgi:hypothetical protein
LHEREASVSQDPNTSLGVPTPPSDEYGAPKVAAAQQVESDQESYTEYHDAGFKIEDEELVGDPNSHRDKKARDMNKVRAEFDKMLEEQAAQSTPHPPVSEFERRAWQREMEREEEE